MLTKAEIQSIDLLNNTCTVRIPYFESAGINTTATAEAIMSILPGVYGGYNVGDIVIVGFEDNQAHHPVVLGKLFEGTNNESIGGGVLCKTLEVENNASIPITTRLLSDTDSKTQQNNSAVYNSIQDIITELNTLKTEIELLKNS